MSAWKSTLCTIFFPNIEDLDFSPQIYLFYKVMYLDLIISLIVIRKEILKIMLINK